MRRPLELVSDDLAHQIRIYNYRLNVSERHGGKAQRIGVSCLCLCPRARNGRVLGAGVALGYVTDTRDAWRIYNEHLMTVSDG